MTVPMPLSPDYKPLKDRIYVPVKKEVTIKRKINKDKPASLYESSKAMGRRINYFYDMQITSPLKYRFIRFHGKGEMVKGYFYYEKYYDDLYEKTQNIIKVLSETRTKSKFADLIGICPTLLTHYTKRNGKKRFITKLQVMRKIIRGFETYELKGNR